MSSKNDVPLGEEARRYYEEKFGDRIRRVRNSDGPTRRIGGEKWEDVKAIVILLGLFLLIGIILAGGRFHSTAQPSRNANPPSLDHRFR
jgi:hypothetical protein